MTKLLSQRPAPDQFLAWRLSNHHQQIAVNNGQRHFVVPFPAAMHRLAAQRGLLMRKGGQAVARKNEDRNSLPLDLSYEIGRLLATKLAGPSPLDCETLRPYVAGSERETPPAGASIVRRLDQTHCERERPPHCPQAARADLRLEPTDSAVRQQNE
jgi:hypothetical protein